MKEHSLREMGSLCMSFTKEGQGDTVLCGLGISGRTLERPVQAKTSASSPVGIYGWGVRGKAGWVDEGLLFQVFVEDFFSNVLKNHQRRKRQK